MADRRYKLTRPAGLDRDALLRSLHKLDMGTALGRWLGVRACQNALTLAQAGESEAWLWGYGLQLALRGHELPVDVGPSSELAEGYRAGAGLLPAGMPLVLDGPLGQSRAIGSRSPGRSWLN